MSREGLTTALYWTGAITAVLFALLLSALSSMYVPYAPTRLAIYVMGFGVAAVIFLLAVYVGFFIRWVDFDGRTSWEWISESGKALQAKSLLGLLIFPAIMGYCAQRALAYPTKWYAPSSFSFEAECERRGVWGKKVRQKVEIRVVDLEAGEELRFPWGLRLAPSCDQKIRISGKRWLFGYYITNVSDAESKP
jgi:hypothetical protein